MSVLCYYRLLTINLYFKVSSRNAAEFFKKKFHIAFAGVDL